MYADTSHLNKPLADRIALYKKIVSPFDIQHHTKRDIKTISALGAWATVTAIPCASYFGYRAITGDKSELPDTNNGNPLIPLAVGGPICFWHALKYGTHVHLSLNNEVELKQFHPDKIKDNNGLIVLFKSGDTQATPDYFISAAVHLFDVSTFNIARYGTHTGISDLRKPKLTYDTLSRLENIEDPTGMYLFNADEGLVKKVSELMPKE